MKDQKNSGLPEHILKYFSPQFFKVLIKKKKHALADSHLTDTRQMIINSSKSVSSIGFVHV
jgi:hypothetical protein